jgi:secreted PhoX family phosphatase
LRPISHKRHRFDTARSRHLSIVRHRFTNQPKDHFVSTLNDFNNENSNTSDNPTFDSVLKVRLSRRGLLMGSVASVSTAVLGGTALTACGGGGSDAVAATPAATATSLGFGAVPKNLADKVIVPAGYTASVIYALGDPLSATTSAFKNDGTDGDFENRAGDHHDGMEYFGLSADGKPSTTSNDRALLGMNHEATTDEKLTSFFQHANGGTASLPRPAAEVDKEVALHGVSVVEISKSSSGKWAYVQASSFNKRFTPLTPMELSGPAKGDALMVTKYSTTGLLCRGTLNNCGTGKTPWGTLLTGEENWAGYFFRSATDDAARDAKSVTALKRYGRSQGASSRHGWETGGSDDKYARWNNSKLGTSSNGADDYRNEMNTFGYVVEIDAYDKSKTAKKRTGLGRFAHESAAFSKPPVVGQPLAVYQGDDARNEYIYKFVSTAVWSAADANPTDRMATGDKYLDSGKLYAAKLNADGSGEWIELNISNAKIAAYAGYSFTNQADVLVNARIAADAVGATKMDRPEWCGVHPNTGEIYFTLTNNSNRAVEPSSSQLAPDNSNPRAYSDAKGSSTSKGNVNGHILRVREGSRRRYRHQLQLGCLPVWRASRCRQGPDQPVEPDRRPGLLQPGRHCIQPVHRHLLDSDRRRRLHRRDQLHDAGGHSRQGG